MNRLAHEPSLYLRQHANNPVDWHPWGEEAWTRARAEDKPVLVSIGYSACHWCHVMAHECFEDAYIADLMNRHFICVKVDREAVSYTHLDVYKRQAYEPPGEADGGRRRRSWKLEAGSWKFSNGRGWRNDGSISAFQLLLLNFLR